MKTSIEWWNEIKANDTLREKWLQRQYVGEMSAVNLLSEVLIKYGSSATPEQMDTVIKVMQQEMLHAKWVLKLLQDRSIPCPVSPKATDRYWAEVLPNITNFDEAMAAAFHAENMRLHRIRAIANDESIDSSHPLADIKEVFSKILPHEEWHEETFGEMRNNADMTRYHDKGLEALNLVLN